MGWGMMGWGMMGWVCRWLGMSLYAKRLERGRFIWPSPADGVVAITAAQLSYMLEGIDWRHPQRTWRQRTWRPEIAG